MLKKPFLVFFVLFSVCLITILFGVPIIRNISMEYIPNTALVVGASFSNEQFLKKTNSLTAQAEKLAKSINSIWVLSYFKKKYEIDLNNVLLQRKNLIIESFKNGVDLNKIKTLSSSIVNTTKDKSVLEQRITITDGEIITFYVDDFENHQPAYEYSISDGKKQYRLISTHNLGYVSGKTTVTGIVFGSTIYATPDVSKIVKRVKTETEIIKDRSSHKTLVILINFLDTTQTPFTKEEAGEIIFNGQLDKYMKEQSFNKVDFEGDVFGWLTMSNNACISNNQSEIDDFVIENNINIGDYDHLLYIMNCLVNYTNGTSTVGKVPYVLGGISGNVSVTYIQTALGGALANASTVNSDLMLPFPLTNLDYILFHELGHALGVYHANGWDCHEEQVITPCDHIEYGNVFDAMGDREGFALHYNGYYKNILGWFNKSDILNISQSGIYKLSPLEQTGIGKKVAFIKLPGQESPIYSLEYRSAVGFDSQLQQTSGDKSGLYINKINLVDTVQNPGGGYPELVDSQPSDLDWWLSQSFGALDSQIASLSNNPIFTDPKSGLTIKPGALSLSPETISFEVTMTPVECINLPPEVTDKPNAYETTSVTAGSQILIWKQITNIDYSSCGFSDFYAEILPNSIITNLNNYQAYGVSPGSQFYIAFIETINSNVAPGIYPIEIRVTNTTTGLSAIKTVDITVIP